MVVVGHASHALRSPFGSLHTIVAARDQRRTYVISPSWFTGTIILRGALEHEVRKRAQLQL